MNVALTQKKAGKHVEQMAKSNSEVDWCSED